MTPKLCEHKFASIQSIDRLNNFLIQTGKHNYNYCMIVYYQCSETLNNVSHALTNLRMLSTRKGMQKKGRNLLYPKA